MEKKKLSRYFWLIHEIERQKQRKERLQKKLLDSRGSVVADTVNDYRSGKGIPVKIEGVAEEEFTLPAIIKILEEEIENNIKESEAEVIEVEKFIQGVEEPKLRELLRSRFIDCMKWDDVGKANFTDPDHARKMVRNFMKDK